MAIGGNREGMSEGNGGRVSNYSGGDKLGHGRSIALRTSTRVSPLFAVRRCDALVLDDLGRQ